MKIFVLRKRWLILSLIFLISSVLLLNLWLYKTLSTSKSIQLNRVIIIDPGHGGIDGGAVGKSGVVESQLNLDIALKLRELLEQSGAIVLLTRDKEEGLYSDTGRIRDKKNEDLRNRKKIVDNSEGDLFISIHLNSFPQGQYYGAQTFYPKASEESKKIAELIQEEFIKVLKNGNNRVSKEKSDVYLLKSCRMPTVLVECGFLSNPMEEGLLQKNIYQEKVAWSIYIGVLRYFYGEEL